MLSAGEGRVRGEPLGRVGGQDVEITGSWRSETGEVMLVLGRWDIRGMRCEGGQLEEERLAAACGRVDERDAFLREHVGEVVRPTVPEPAEHPVLVQRVVELAVSPAGDVPLVPAGRDIAGRDVGDGAVGEVAGDLKVTVEVLAHHRGSIAGALERDREGVALLMAAMERLKPTRRAEVAPHVRVVGEIAGEDGGARRATERVGHEVVREGEAVPLHRHHMRHEPDQVAREVVGQDEHDVGPRRAERRGGRGRTTNLPRSRACPGRPAAARRQSQPGPDQQPSDKQAARRARERTARSFENQSPRNDRRGSECRPSVLAADPCKRHHPRRS